MEPSCYRVSRYEGFPEQYTDSHGNKAMRTKVNIPLIFIYKIFLTTFKQGLTKKNKAVAFFTTLKEEQCAVDVVEFGEVIK